MVEIEVGKATVYLTDMNGDLRKTNVIKMRIEQSVIEFLRFKL